MGIRHILPRGWLSSAPEAVPENRRDWVLALLYAPDETGAPAPTSIPGEFTMSLGLFAVTRRVRSVSGRETYFKFEASERGPRDPKLSEALSTLTDEELVEDTGKPETEFGFDESTYRITDAGREVAAPIYRGLSDTEQSEIERLKYDYVLAPTGDLVVYCFGIDSSFFLGDLVRG